MIDYFKLLNARDGGINGVKMTWEKCETEYRNDRGVECYERSKKKGPTGATLIHPLSTGITYSLIDKGTADKIPIVSVGYGRTDAADGRVFPYVFPMITTYWSQNTAKIKFIGQKEGGMDKLKGKKIVNLYHDSAYGKETIPILDAAGEEVRLPGHAHRGAAPGQRAAVAVAAGPPGQARLGDPARLGRDEPDRAQGGGENRLPARQDHRRVVVGRGGGRDSGGRRRQGLHRRGLQRRRAPTPGACSEIQKHVYAKGQGEMEDKSRIGSIYYNRGVLWAILTTEAVRTAQGRYGKGQPMTGEQVRWGLENLQHRRQAPEGARRRRLHAAAQDVLRGPRGRRPGEVPAVGRQAVEGDHRLDSVGPASGAPDDRGLGGAVRQGERHHAQGLLKRKVIFLGGFTR